MRHILPCLIDLTALNLPLLADYDADSLKGLPGLGVIVEDLGDDVEGKGGLFKQDIQTDVELALRMAGIKVLSPTERSEHAAAPYLSDRPIFGRSVKPSRTMSTGSRTTGSA